MLSKATRTRLVWRNGKKVREHRWIMEQHLGQPLADDEDVHHLNHNSLDNRIENLQVMKRADHIALHAVEKQRHPDQKTCVACGAPYQANPRKRQRSKCCGPACAQKVRVAAALKARGIAA